MMINTLDYQLKIWTKSINLEQQTTKQFRRKKEDMKAYQIVVAIDPTMAGLIVTVIHCTQPHPTGTK